jgi:hypothetical protein
VDLGGNAAVDMVCVQNTCVVDCETGGDGLCTAVDASLTCSEAAGDICVLECDAGACPSGYSCFDAGGEDECLPNGTFPGSACGASNFCAQDLGGNTAVDMACVSGTCVVTCAGNNDALCGAVDASLTCSESAGNICVLECGGGGSCLPGFSCLDEGGENACLPTGSFPGSPCRATVGNECDQNLGGNAAVDMACVDDTCVVTCAGNNDALCAAVDAGLTCSESAGNICVLSCATDACPTDYSCLEFNDEDACLPTGSFPSSPCRSTPGDECDQDLLGMDQFDMECTAADLCAVQCDTNNDDLCAAFNPTWTCSTVADNVCLISCASSSCPAGYGCVNLDEPVCLPN